MIKQEPEKVYRNVPGLNYSSIKVGIDKSLLHMRHEMTRTYSKSTASQRIGTLAHALILEPAKFGGMIAIWQGYEKADGEIAMSKNSKAFKEFEKANTGKHIISPDEFCQLERIKEAVYSNPKAREILNDSQKEVACCWEDPLYGKAKARFDVLQPDGMVWDVKTCADISAFERSAIKYGYHYQAGWYSHGAEESGYCPSVPFGWIVVETSPPYDVAVLTADFTLVEIGYKACLDCAIRYRDAEKNGVYPGYYNDVDVVATPEWMLDEMND